MSSYTGFTFHRLVRRWRRDIKLWQAWTINYLNRHVFGAWHKLGKTRWLVASWAFIVLVSLWGLLAQMSSLNASLKQATPQKGGIYREAILGQVKSINPLFADNSATEDVNSLVFSGLTKINGNREIVPDLAESWEVSPDKKVYTFKIRKNAKWQDGIAITANDIAFTIGLVQNPDTRSPLAANWNGVKYEVIDNETIRFSLPSSYGNFLTNTTLGILPKHKLNDVKPSSLRSNEFNQRPVGSGPYKIDLLEVDSSVVDLKANPNYYIHEPYITTMRIELFQNSDEMIGALVRKQVDAVSAVLPQDVATVEKIQGVNDFRIGLPAYVGAFFNLKSPLLSDVKVRQAMAYAINRKAIIDTNLSGEAALSYYPIPAGFIGFNPNAQKYETDQAKAKELISQSSADKANIRIVTLKNPTYEKIANTLASYWKQIGLNPEVITADAVQLQQNFIRSRNYDILLYGQNLGIDSDVYSFWHSSQASDPGLNVSSYKNTEVDQLLEAGRLAKDASYKASRYTAFVEKWANDLPAIILYSPYYNYAQSDLVKGFEAKKIAEPSNRFYNVYDWYFTNQ